MSPCRQDLPKTVFDPALTPREQRMLGAADRASRTLASIAENTGPACDRRLVAYLLLAGGAAAAEVALPGIRWAWAGFIALAVVAAALATAGGRIGARRYRDRYVHPDLLDPNSRQLLARAQAAINEVRSAAVRRAGYLDTLSSEAVLRAREWDLATRLRELSRLSVSAAQHPAGAAAADPRQAILGEVAASAARRVEELEQYASRVRDADFAYRSWAGPGDPGDDLLSLLAGTASDGQASAELAGLILDADAAGQYFSAP